MKILKTLTLIMSFFCLIPAPHIFPIPIAIIEYFDFLDIFNDPHLSTAPIMIGQILMFLGIIKNEKNALWILGFILFGTGYFFALNDHYPYIKYFLKSIPDLLVCFGPYFILGVLSIMAIIKNRTEYNKS